MIPKHISVSRLINGVPAVELFAQALQSDAAKLTQFEYTKTKRGTRITAPNGKAEVYEKDGKWYGEANGIKLKEACETEEDAIADCIEILLRQE